MDKIPYVDTFRLKEEYSTNSKPMQFLCNVSQVYYVKYVLNHNTFDQLVYELLLAKLCKYYGINTPDVAFVNVIAEAFNPSEIYYNAKNFRACVVAFGSKQVDYIDNLSKVGFVAKRSDFKQFEAPLDLVKIGLLDLLTDNRDRWEENYNILLTQGAKKRFYAIDHTECFCGTMNVGKFSSKINFNIKQSVFTSDYFRQMLRFMKYEEMISVIDNFIYLSQPFDEVERIIDEVFLQIPSTWQLSPRLRDRIVDFLSNQERIENIQSNVKELVLYYKMGSKL